MSSSASSASWAPSPSSVNDNSRGTARSPAHNMQDNTQHTGQQPAQGRTLEVGLVNQASQGAPCMDRATNWKRGQTLVCAQHTADSLPLSPNQMPP